MRDPARGDLVFLGSLAGRLAGGQRFGDPPGPPRKRFEPVRKIDANAGDVGGRGMLVLKNWCRRPDDNHLVLEERAVIKFVRPIDRHQGCDEDVLRQRHETYEAAKARHPERWGSRSTRNWDRPQRVSVRARPEKKEQTAKKAA